MAEEILAIAKSEMSVLCEQMGGSVPIVVLTDMDGVVLHCVGGVKFEDTDSRVGLLEGAIWTEQLQGTNGIGTCLVERQPLVVRRAEHFLRRNVGLTCVAAPIFAPDGELIGVLNTSSHIDQAQEHVLGLVHMAAKAIESGLFLRRFRSHYIVRFHHRPEFVGTLCEGEVAVSEEGKIEAANRAALAQLGNIAQEQIKGKNIGDIFCLTVGDLFDLSAQRWSILPTIHHAKRGSRFFARIQSPETAAPRHATRSGSPLSPRREWLQCDTRTPIRDSIYEDRQWVDSLAKTTHALRHDIAVHIHGESGTGKEVLARAVHQTCLGDHRPFIAVNCASMPATLIESELFGYAPGAFTGASGKGRRGKIAQANGGTLFLDEIGDMPLPLQACLLRVLEEREISPLGTEMALKVDFRLVSATHHDLRTLLAKGQFRPDLYYRLNGIQVSLPPLRHRTDRDQLIRQILAEETAGQQPVDIDKDAMSILQCYTWPGNLRQVRNVLRTALKLMEGTRISICDLPDVIVQGHSAKELRDRRPAVMDRSVLLKPLELAQRTALLDILARHAWIISDVAQELRMSVNVLRRNMKRLHIQSP